jgi:hypothetical protein
MPSSTLFRIFEASGFFVGFSDPSEMASNRFLVHDLGIGTLMYK